MHPVILQQLAAERVSYMIANAEDRHLAHQARLARRSRRSRQKTRPGPPSLHRGWARLRGRCIIRCHELRSPARFVRAGELSADLVGVGMLHVLEHGQCLLPGLPGLGQLAGGVAGVAKVGEGTRFEAAVAAFL
jgi:hypothetical protein